MPDTRARGEQEDRLIPRSQPVQPGWVVAVAVATQTTAGLGFSAVLAHLVLHLHRDLGFTASAVGLVLGARALTQYALHLPAGGLVDRVGASTVGAFACHVRGLGFALLAVATERPLLIFAALLIGGGGSMYTPAGQALLARLPQDWPQRGFAWYTAAGQVAAIGGPALGLALLYDQEPTIGGGFAHVAWLAAGLWLTGGVLLSLLARHDAVDRSAARQLRQANRGSALRVAVGDPGLRRLAGAAWPTTLLITQAPVVVPHIAASSTSVATYLTTGAVMTGAVQLPACRPFATRYGMSVGLAGFAIAYVLLALTVALGPAPAGPSVFITSGIAYGAAQGLLVRAVFHRITQTAHADAIGSYVGALQFLTGVVAFIGGLVIGAAFDHGTSGALVATLMLSISSAVAACASYRTLRAI